MENHFPITQSRGQLREDERRRRTGHHSSGREGLSTLLKTVGFILVDEDGLTVQDGVYYLHFSL